MLLRFLDHATRVPGFASCPARRFSRDAATPTHAAGRRRASASTTRPTPAYRAHDDGLVQQSAVRGRSARLAAARVRGMTPPIDVLDLGCGTGRYFCALRGVRRAGWPRRLGRDARPGAPSVPRRGSRRRVALVEGDLLTHDVRERIVRSRVFRRRARRARAARRAIWWRACRGGCGPADALRSRRCIPSRRRCRRPSAAASARMLEPVDARSAGPHLRAATAGAAACMQTRRAFASCCSLRSPSNRWSDSPPRPTFTCACVARRSPHDALRPPCS